MRILGLMSARKISCAETCTAEEAAILLSGITGGILPVVNSDSAQVVGVITERSLCNAVLSAGLDPAITLVMECLDDTPAVCGSQDDVHHVLLKVAQACSRGAVVVNESNEFVGVVSLSSLALYMATAAQELYVALQKVNRKSIPANSAA
jgi:CBS domain-containing protein